MRAFNTYNLIETRWGLNSIREYKQGLVRWVRTASLGLRKASLFLVVKGGSLVLASRRVQTAGAKP